MHMFPGVRNKKTAKGERSIQGIRYSNSLTPTVCCQELY